MRPEWRSTLEDAFPLLVASTAVGREPNAHVAHGEAVEVPGAATRDLSGLDSHLRAAVGTIAESSGRASPTAARTAEEARIWPPRACDSGPASGIADLNNYS
jgi:hypothetical protein